MHSPDTRQVHRPTVVASGGAPAAPAPELTRRVFLNRFSVGAGAVIVVAGGGLAWRAPQSDLRAGRPRGIRRAGTGVHGSRRSPGPRRMAWGHGVPDRLPGIAGVPIAASIHRGCDPDLTNVGSRGGPQVARRPGPEPPGTSRPGRTDRASACIAQEAPSGGAGSSGNCKYRSPSHPSSSPIPSIPELLERMTFT